ncbi:MAG: FHA domain-containing protein [Anaerolineae bacterium]|nr:FHA domain-containing protein [Anaerolineae bacterium]
MSFRRKRGEISITFMSGPLDGKTITFDQPDAGETSIITIGRRDTCDIHLPFDNQVSRLHARVGCVANAMNDEETLLPSLLAFWLEDSNSRNGTYIEKDPDPLQERQNMRPGTIFRIGRTWLRLDVPLSFG